MCVRTTGERQLDAGRKQTGQGGAVIEITCSRLSRLFRFCFCLGSWDQRSATFCDSRPAPRLNTALACEASHSRRRRLSISDCPRHQLSPARTRTLFLYRTGAVAGGLFSMWKRPPRECKELWWSWRYTCIGSHYQTSISGADRSLIPARGGRVLYSYEKFLTELGRKAPPIED